MALKGSKNAIDGHCPAFRPIWDGRQYARAMTSEMMQVVPVLVYQYIGVNRYE